MPGWPELLIIALIALFVIGPKDLPVMMYKCGQALRRLQYIRFAFSQQFDQFMKEQEFKEMQEDAKSRQPLENTTPEQTTPEQTISDNTTSPVKKESSE